MANIDSTLISNLAAEPRVRQQPWNSGVVKTTGPGIVEVSTATDANDVLRFVRIPSSARVFRVLLSCDAVAAAGAINVGLYAANGGAVVDADFFASAQVVTTALVMSNITHESGVFGIEDRGQRLWEALGLSEDPMVDYDVCGVVTTDMGGAGTLVVEVEYVD